MAKRVYVSFGFDSSGVMAVVTELGLQSGDSIILIVPRIKSNRSESAKKNIETFFHMLRNRGLNFQYKYLEVNEEEPAEIIETLVKSVMEWNGEVIFEATGGLRIICVAMLLTATLLPEKVNEYYSVAESVGKRVKIPLPKFHFQLDNLYIKILENMGEKATLEELAFKLKKSKSTLSRQMDKLEELNAVRKIRDRPATFTKTFLGKILLLKKKREKVKGQFTL